MIDEQDFKLASVFANQTLSEIILHPTPSTGGGVPILFGVTAESGVSAVPLPAALP